jgi:hypothetical protein
MPQLCSYAVTLITPTPEALLAAGRLLGPRMIIAGPMLDGPLPRFPSSAPIANAAHGRRAVDELKTGGVDFMQTSPLCPPRPETRQPPLFDRSLWNCPDVSVWLLNGQRGCRGTIVSIAPRAI